MKQGQGRLKAAALAAALAVAGMATFVATGVGDDGDVNEIGGSWGESRIVPSETVGPRAAAAAGVASEVAGRRRIVLKVTYRSARNPITVAPAGQEGSAAIAGVKCKRRETPFAGGFGSNLAGLAESFSAPQRKAWVTGVFNASPSPIDFTPITVCAKFKR